MQPDVLISDAPRWRTTISPEQPNSRTHSCHILICGALVFRLWIHETPHGIAAWISGLNEFGEWRRLARQDALPSLVAAAHWAQKSAIELLTEAHQIVQTLPTLKVWP